MCFCLLFWFHNSVSLQQQAVFSWKKKKSDKPTVRYPQQQADSDKMKNKEKRLAVEGQIFLSGVDEDHNRTKCVSGQMFADMLAKTI